MVRRLLARLRASTAIAAALALVVAGAAAGAAGSYLVLGQNNDSGTSQTVLQNAGLGAAFTLKTTNVSTGATGIFGWSSQTGTNATRGVYGLANGANSYGVYGRNNGAAGTGAGVYADGGQNTGIIATSGSGTGIEATAGTCSTLFCGRNGVEGTGYGFGTGVRGDGGLTGVTGSSIVGLWGIDDSGDGSGFGLITDGNASIDGDLEVTGTCTGCSAALVGVNASGTPLSQGDAVAVTGVTTDASGRVVVQVVAAQGGDPVIGVVDGAVAATTTDLDAESSVSGYKRVGTSAAAGGMLRIIISGVVTFAKGDASGGVIAAGDSLAAGSAGHLMKASTGTASGMSLGYALGTLKDGRIAVLIAPH